MAVVPFSAPRPTATGPRSEEPPGETAVAAVPPSGHEAIPAATSAPPSGSDALPDDPSALPDDPEELASGNEALPDGTKALVNGAEALPPRDEALPIGTRVLPDGAGAPPDGTKAQASDAEALPPGEEARENGTEALRDGAEAQPTGLAEQPSDAALAVSKGEALENSLGFSPDGRLYLWHDPEEAQQPDEPTAARLRAAFDRGSGHGLFLLGTREARTVLPPTLRFWREFAGLFMQRLVRIENLESHRHDPAVSFPSEDVVRWLETAPPCRGAEYLREPALRTLWEQMRQAFIETLAEWQDTVDAYFQTVNPLWNMLGRVCFHLAERKVDPAELAQGPERPFAFLATYTSGISAHGKPAHQPLSEALKEFAGARDRTALIKLLVQGLRRQWPAVRIIVRGDSGFCRQRLLRFCERNGVGDVIGLAHNARLQAHVAYAELMPEDEYAGTGAKERLVEEFAYAAASRARERRVITRLAYGSQGPNPRFVVTNLAGEATELYDRLYCGCGEA
jgi:hypothetical protein